MVIDIDSGFCMSYWRHFATFHIYICTKFILSRFLPCYRFTQYSNPVHDYNMPEVWDSVSRSDLIINAAGIRSITHTNI